jgi:FKBP-type peptidyl-prolyl cis-trans isomerase SlyD
MKITKDTVVTMDYELRLQGDDVIDASSDGAFAFLVGHQNIVPGLESRLIGLEKGTELDVQVLPEDGYGARDEGRVVPVPRSVLPDGFEVEIGVPLELEDENGETMPGWIAGTHGDDVVLDLNHPLAGEVLNFKVKISDVRAATQTELAHGHVHGPGVHAH